MNLIHRYPGTLATLICLAGIGVLLAFAWTVSFTYPPVNTDGWGQVVEDTSRPCTPYEPEVRPCPRPSPRPVEHHADR